MDSNCLAPPSSQVDTRHRSSSKSETIVSTVSNPFQTPLIISSASSILDDPDPLRPDPGTESDFLVDDNPFAFSPGQLNKLLNPKSLNAFQALGGLDGIVAGLQTDIKTGLSVDETSIMRPISFSEVIDGAITPTSSQNTPSLSTKSFEDRIRVYKRNVLPLKKATPLWKLVWNAYNDKVLILLTVAAVISLALGLYETLGVEHEPGAPTPVDWIEGVAICAAIFIVVFVGSINDWQKERAFVKLNAKKDDRDVKATRSGKPVVIDVADILVGDVIHLEAGDLVPVDGIFIDGHDVKCDESSATGESDALKKTGGAAVMYALKSGNINESLDPFIISGSKVLEGVGTFVCTSVGMNSSFGKILMSVRTETEPTPLQNKLEGLAMAIAKLGSASAGLLFFILLFRFIGGLPNDTRLPVEKASSFMDILIVAVTIIVVAVPEGLPLAVTLALAFATTRMLKEKNLVRVLRACETMGNATAICSDKTGTLTTNKMTVVSGTFGSSSFASFTTQKTQQSIQTWVSSIPSTARDLIVKSVALNSTAFEGEEDGIAIFLGSKTETTLLQFAKDHLGMQSLNEIRSNEKIVHMIPFDSGRKCMGAVMKLRTGGYRLLVKGASEILLNFCSARVNSDSPEHTIEPLDDNTRTTLSTTIFSYATKSLRTIALVYRDFEQWQPVSGDTGLDELLCDLVFLGLVGIQDPVREGVPEAVRKAQNAGIAVRMVTGDNAQTARAIAIECGIYVEGQDGIVMEGSDFRRLSDNEMEVVLPKLQVLARSSPEDKRILVSKLKAQGQTVAVTGDGTNDAPALNAADIGFSMGIAGTEVAKEASAIILMDDNFTSTITALKWGRAANDAVQKFLQFQITVNITAVVLAFITAVYDGQSVLKTVQLLWVNLTMDTFAALALATDPPTEKILNRPPQGKDKPLISTNMWKMIIGQSIYQLVVVFTLYFAGDKILDYVLSNKNEKLELETIIFNCFVWMFNIFEGVHRNPFFIVINCVMVGLQVGIIFIGSRAFSISPNGLDGTQWAISVVVAIFCLPWAILVRLFPDAWFATIARSVGKPFGFVYRRVAIVWAKFRSVFTKKKVEDAESGAPAVVINSPVAQLSEKNAS